MNKLIRILAMVAVFILVADNAAFTGEKSKQCAVNNKWVRNFNKIALKLESQQVNNIVSYFDKRLIVGKFNSMLKKIEPLEKKKVSNPIFLISITDEDKKDPFWKGVIFLSSPVRFVFSLQAIVIDESAEFGEESMAIAFARECWVAYCAREGKYDRDTEWNAQAFLIRCMESLGGEKYTQLVYTEAKKLAEEIENNADGWRSHHLAEPTKYDERLTIALWKPASDEEERFIQRCFWIHIMFIVIENNPGIGYVAQQKAEFIKSIGHHGNTQSAGKLPARNYYLLYTK